MHSVSLPCIISRRSHRFHQSLLPHHHHHHLKHHRRLTKNNSSLLRSLSRQKSNPNRCCQPPSAVRVHRDPLHHLPNHHPGLRVPSSHARESRLQMYDFGSCPVCCESIITILSILIEISRFICGMFDRAPSFTRFRLKPMIAKPVRICFQAFHLLVFQY